MTQNKAAFLKDVKLARLAQKNRDAAQEVLRRVYPRVRHVVHMVVRRHGEADDLVQMCLVEVLEHVQQFRGEGQLESWAGQLTYRVVMRELKKRQQQSQRICDLAAQSDTPGVVNPEREISRRQLWDQLMTKIETIPAKRRTALLMHLVYDYTIPEVAELTEVSVNTVKDRLKKAYRELRKIVNGNLSLCEAMLEEIDE